jgi:hypothetical protein
MTLQEAIRLMVNPLIKPDILLAKVIEFDADKWLATVELNTTLKIDEVRVRAVVNTELNGMFIEPKDGSYVLVGLIEGKIENLFVITFSEIVKYHLKADLIEFNGDAFGGIAKVQEIEANLNAIKDYLSTLNSAIYTGINAVGVSTAASGTIGAKAFDSAMEGQVINFSNMENTSIKHG